MLVIFPFEEELYRAAGVPVSFVGHPLVDLVQPADDRAAFLREYGLDPARPVDRGPAGQPPRGGGATTCRRSRAPRACWPPGGPSCSSSWRSRRRSTRHSWTRPSREPRCGGRGRTHEAVSAATLALVASGTATVETALLGTPMVVVYRISPLTYVLGRPFVRVPHYAMVNLIAGRRVVPELIQGDFTPERVAAEAESLLSDAGRAARMRADLAEVRQRLGEPGASRRAAQQVADLLQGPRTPSRG